MPAVHLRRSANRPAIAIHALEQGEAWKSGVQRRSLGATAEDRTCRPPPFTAQIRELTGAARHTDESLAVLAHELRTPLTAIAHAMAVLRIQTAPESGQDRIHAVINRQLRQMNRLVSSLYDRSSDAHGGLQLQRQRIDLRRVMEEAVEDIRPELERRRQSLEMVVSDRSLWLSADGGRLEQVFNNLLSNASKCTDAGGNIALFIDTAARYVKVRIRDSGIGIAADSLLHIFEPFVRANSADVRSRPGLGIGLALVHAIVEAHGGSVSAHSEGVGLGSEFTVLLPLFDGESCEGVLPKLPT